MIFFQSDIPVASLNRQLPAYETYTGLILMRHVCIMRSVYAIAYTNRKILSVLCLEEFFPI